mmetsp:Transcript_14027/g.39695  ORF Transcript_14027/g.39695 Transcript_14027/m.39695 type:complete len:274 (+) Transcript_14027:238-1059(+)
MFPTFGATWRRRIGAFHGHYQLEWECTSPGDRQLPPAPPRGTTTGNTGGPTRNGHYPTPGPRGQPSYGPAGPRPNNRPRPPAHDYRGPASAPRPQGGAPLVNPWANRQQPHAPNPPPPAAVSQVGAFNSDEQEARATWPEPCDPSAPNVAMLQMMHGTMAAFPTPRVRRDGGITAKATQAEAPAPVANAPPPLAAAPPTTTPVAPPVATAPPAPAVAPVATAPVVPPAPMAPGVAPAAPTTAATPAATATPAQTGPDPKPAANRHVTNIAKQP